QGFKPPADYPEVALATVATHDLPTLAGYWQGHDLTQRTEFGLFGSDEVRAQALVGRAQDRSRLLLALEREQLLPAGMSADPQSAPEMSEELIRSVHVYLARAPAKVMMIQPEDVLGQVEPVNLPGTSEEAHPNWRRKLVLPLEQWAGHDGFLRLAAALREQRPAGPGRHRRRGHGAAIPRATYRLQLNSGFTFRDAAALVPYLAALGISHVYCSPYLRARPGSPHGYDIIDHNALNPEIGSAEDFDAFCQALEVHGMSQIIDVVPNHMGVMGADNAWWLDVLENGPASLYADYFDIDWRPAKAELYHKLLLPVLGGVYGEVLERGELELRFEPGEGAFSVWYYQHRLPLAPESYPALLDARADTLTLKLGEQHPQLLELRSLISAFRHLPPRDETATDRLLERQRDVQLHKQRLARLCAESAELASHLAETATGYNGQPGDPRSFDALHALLEEQAYRLAHWHTAADEVNYRRFFDIHDLAALRMEDTRVFESTHQLVLRLVQEGKVEGLRIDHPDGLYDPYAYFLRLQERAAGETALPEDKPLYLLVEKILAPDEPLPPYWPVHGTTGYDFLGLVNGLLVDPASSRDLLRFYRVFSGAGGAFAELVYKCKRLIMKYALASELHTLAFQLNRMSEADRRTRDFTFYRLRQALAEMIAWLPVYRTYERGGEILERDRRYIEQALQRAIQGSRDEETEVYRFLRRVLLHEGLSGDMLARANRFVMKLQQYTGAVMAKGLEDTAFYRYFPLISLNEVGSEPSRFGITIEQFHHANAERQRHWPHAMLATSSHDNKRSEDVRARINVLSELRREWRRQVRTWTHAAAPAKHTVDGVAAPSRNDEYLFYQTLIGTWPLGEPDAAAWRDYVARIEAYMLKAVREAKQHTSWINPNQPYEMAVSSFVTALLADQRFLALVRPFQQQVARFGLYNSLSQTLLKLTAPGVPDIYQGNELWDFSMVDPDNRRAIGYAHRAESLRALGPPSSQQMQALLASLDDGRTKLAVTRYVLLVRQQHETLFRDGSYIPLATSGQKADHLVAFGRRRRQQTAIVVAPRLYAHLLLGDHRRLPLGEEIWGDTRIELEPLADATTFNNSLTGATVAVEVEAGRRFIRAREVLADFPVALLIGTV
ncbi:MAG TPA: malto-oligosyltrehalose synthase, partial [Gammaproteobacteria bacterium]|nr:malto-oligosyltrehalose synthase [Gammaproteobacteria bacterium]